MGDVVQAVMEEISLERNFNLWTSEKDTRSGAAIRLTELLVPCCDFSVSCSRDEAVRRLKLLAEFPQTSFTEVSSGGVPPPGAECGQEPREEELSHGHGPAGQGREGGGGRGHEAGQPGTLLLRGQGHHRLCPQEEAGAVGKVRSRSPAFSIMIPRHGW